MYGQHELMQEMKTHLLKTLTPSESSTIDTSAFTPQFQPLFRNSETILRLSENQTVAITPQTLLRLSEPSTIGTSAFTPQFRHALQTFLRQSENQTITFTPQIQTLFCLSESSTLLHLPSRFRLSSVHSNHWKTRPSALLHKSATLPSLL